MMLCLASCGPRMVRGQSPFVQVTAWEIHGHRLSMELRIRNVNDEELRVINIEFDVRLQDTELAHYMQVVDTVISANGSETLALELDASQAGVDLLVALGEGRTDSLPYSFEGQLQASEKEFMKFERKGHIYTVPGRPGRFR